MEEMIKNNPFGTCSNCGKTTDRITKRMCFNCYRRFAWNRKKVECKRCKRMLPMKAKGYCGGCYNYVFRLEEAKAYQNKKLYNVNMETYKRITSKCLICGFDKVVQLHHLDHNHKNNNEENLIGLCPNHHRMLHDFQYRDEIKKQIEEKLSQIKN